MHLRWLQAHEKFEYCYTTSEQEQMKALNRNIIGNPSQISDRFIDVVKRSGLKHFRFHDLRHYHASISHALGVPDQYIMLRGVWASDTVLKAVYRHTMSDKIEGMNNVANEHFKSILQHEIQHEKNNP